jgi:peptide subunit release factor 1 (eRF1)
MENTEEAVCLVEFLLLGDWKEHGEFPVSEAIMQATDLRNSQEFLQVRVKLRKPVGIDHAWSGFCIWFWENAPDLEETKAARADQYAAYSETYPQQDTGRD